MAVAFDAVSQPSPVNTTNGTSSSPITWTHTPVGTPTDILIGVSTGNGTSNAVTAVTYGGVSCSIVGAWVESGTSQAAGGQALYWCSAPPSGAQTVSVTYTSTNVMISGAMSLTGGGGGLGNNNSSNPVTAASSVSTTISNTTTGGMIGGVTCFGGGSTNTGVFSGTNSVTVRYQVTAFNATAADNSCGGTVPSTGGGATQTVGFSNTNSDNWGFIAVEVLPGGGGGGVAFQLPTQADRARFRHHQGVRRQQIQPVFSGVQILNVNAGLATGVGGALDWNQSMSVGLTPALASGTGGALDWNQSMSVGLAPALATGTGAANTPGRGNTIGLPSGTGAAQAVGGGLTSGLATGTGAVQFAGTGLVPGLASGTGAADIAQSSVGANAGLATGIGVALGNTSGLTIGLTPGLATGTSTAQTPQNGLSSAAGLASGVGAANAPNLGFTPGLSSGTGAAQAVGGGLTSGLSTGAGAVPFTGTGLTPGLSSGTGAALDWNQGLSTALTPGLATGTGTALDWNQGLSTGLTPGLATGIGVSPAAFAQVPVSSPSPTLTTKNYTQVRHHHGMWRTQIQQVFPTPPFSTAVTTTFTGSPAGSQLKVVVLTGANESGGAQAAFAQSSAAAPTFTLTPNGSNSLPLFVIYDQTGGSSGQYTAASNNTLLDNSIQHDAFCDGYYSGTVTSGTPVTLGSTTPSADKQVWASYEVLSSSGSTPVQDVSTPAVVISSASNTATTLTFTPPPGSVLVALASGNNAASDGTISDTGGLTWTLRSHATGSGGTSDVWTATVPGGSGNLSVVAGLATATGTAQTPGTALTPALATGTGAAQAVGGGLTSGLATGAGAAQFAGTGLTPSLATGTGAADTPGTGLGAALASGTGNAQTPALGLTTGIASGTGAAQAVGGGRTTGLATGSGTAQFAGTGLTPALATGIGTANNATANIIYGQVNVDYTGSTLTDPNTLGGTVSVATLGGTLSVTANTLGGTLAVTSDTFTGTLSEFTLGGTAAVTSDTLTGTLSVAANTLSGTTKEDKMQEVDITLNEFNDATVTFQILNNGSPYNITGMTVNALFKKTRGDLDSAGTTKTYSSGGGSPAITIVTPTTGSCSLAIPHGDIQSGSVWSFYRIDVVNGSVTTTAIFGTVTITQL